MTDPETGATLDTVVDRGPRAASTPPAVTPPVERRYELGDEIAHGGMGRVVEATDTLLGRTVALKQARLSDPDSLRRFARETRITARLEHPSIVPVYDAGRDPDGSPYYVMRKVTGQPLSKLVKAAASPADRLALLPHVAAAANAVAHAHRRGVVHRDLKPSNILVGELGETIVIDWGIAKVIGEADDDAPDTPPPDPAGSLRTAYGTVIGTPGYMAPEQIRCEPVDARADVYALGATLYHLLAGRSPYLGSGSDVMEAQLADTPPPLDDVPPELATIVDTALARDQGARYRDAGELAADLQRFLTGQLVAAHRYSPRARVARFVRRHRVAILVAAFAASALVGGGVMSVRSIVRERDRADEEARLATERQHVAEAATAEATDRADRLVVQQALSLVASNPTAAVALVKPIAARGRWREARDIGFLAHQHGVAWRAPSSLFTRGLDLSPDGIHAATCGADGVLRMLDLPKRETTELWHADPQATKEIDCLVRFVGSRLAVLRDGRLDIADLAGAVQRTIPVTGRVEDLVVVGDHVGVWTTGDGHAFEWVDTGTGAVEPIALSGIVQVKSSPDGARLAIAGGMGVMVAAPGSPPRALATGEAWSVAWIDDGSVLASIGNDMRTLRVADGSTAETWRDVGHMYLAHGSGAHRYFAGNSAQLYDRDAKIPEPGDGHAMRILDGGRATTLFVRRSEVVVRTDDLDLHLRAPSDLVGYVQARPSSPYVITAAPGLVLVWNLDELIPRHATHEPMNNIIFAEDRLVAQSVPERRVSIDLATLAETTLDAPMLMATVGTTKPGTLVGLDFDAHAFLLDTDRGATTNLADHVGMVGRTSTGALLAYQDGRLELFDPLTNQRRTLGPVRPSGKLVALAWSGAWTVELLDDGTILRVDTSPGSDRVESIHATGTADGSVVARPSGEVFYASDATLFRWGVDGTVEEWAQLPHDLHDVQVIDEHHVIATTIDTAGYVIDLDTRATVASTFRVGESRARLVGTAGLMTLKEATGLRLLDPLTDVDGPLVDQLRHSTLEAAISPDVKWMYVNSLEGVLLWRIDLPTDQASTVRYLDRMTNATAERGPAALVWR